MCLSTKIVPYRSTTQIFENETVIKAELLSAIISNPCSPTVLLYNCTSALLTDPPEQLHSLLIPQAVSAV